MGIFYCIIINVKTLISSIMLHYYSTQIGFKHVKYKLLGNTRTVRKSPQSILHILLIYKNVIYSRYRVVQKKKKATIVKYSPGDSIHSVHGYILSVNGYLMNTQVTHVSMDRVNFHQLIFSNPHFTQYFHHLR